MDLYFYFILGTAVVFGTAFTISTRGILYATPDTDNELMTYAAAQSHKWRWPSDLHKYGVGKTSMKDVAILLLAPFQWIMRDKESNHPYTALAGFSVAITSILVYLIIEYYFGAKIGVFVSLLYLISFWPWQIALQTGHVSVAGMVFLTSIISVQQIDLLNSNNYSWLILSGFLFCLTQFSSASATKYTPLFLGAVIFEVLNISEEIKNLSNLYSAINIFIPTLFLVAFALIKLTYKKIISAMYNNESLPILNQMLAGRNIFPLEHYYSVAEKKINQKGKLALELIFLFLIIHNFVGLKLFLYIAIGFVLGFLFLNLPNLKKNFSYYYEYLKETQLRKKSHFRLYIDYFAQRGITVSRYTMGAGPQWVPKVFWRLTMPHVVLFSISLICLTILRITTGQLNFIPTDILILATSLSPILWAELTKAPQISRTYSPGLVSSFLLVGYSFHIFSKHINILPILIGILIPTLTWNLWKFISDVYPARMGSARLVKILNNLNIKDIYTYRTSYNKNFVGTIPGLGTSEYAPRRKIDPPFTVHYINSLSEVKDGWIVIPGTNGKSAVMVGEPEAIDGGLRYTKDPILNKLLDSKDIEKVATARIKTLGSSAFWPLESEVFGYVDLTLHEIKSEDIYRGYAWLVHSSKLIPTISNYR